MKILFDTSVLVAAIVEVHPMHPQALKWLQRAKAGEFDIIVASHTLAELYAILTTLPVKPRISPGTAWRLIHDNIDNFAKVVHLTVSDYRYVLKQMADFLLTGGIIYDAIIARAAQKTGVDRLLTFNPEDFKRAWPEGNELLVVP